MVSVDDFDKQIDNIEYKGKMYSARDNGAILRHPKNLNNPRKNDNIWTFGKQDPKTRYMLLSCERVHRIIATGFLGKAPSKDHIVDHIDTNRANNRPENLRWITKFENAILNPITAKRIATKCGSVENFLKNPEKYREILSSCTDISWMRTVSKKEAQNCLKNLSSWAQKDNTSYAGKSIDDWIFHSEQTNYNNHFNSGNSHPQLNVKYSGWTPTYFPCCPPTKSKTPLKDYYEKLEENCIFASNQYTSYKVIKKALCDDFIVVLTEDNAESPIKPWCVNKISFKNNVFEHEIFKTCFEYNGAEMFFAIAQGLEWNGPDSIDKYC